MLNGLTVTIQIFVWVIVSWRRRILIGRAVAILLRRITEMQTLVTCRRRIFRLVVFVITHWSLRLFRHGPALR